MRKVYMISGVLLMMTGSLFAQKKEEKKLIEARIEANSKKLEGFLARSMTDSIAAMFSPNCHLLAEYQPIIESEEKVKDYFEGEQKSGKKISGYKLETEEIKVYDEIALEIGTATLEYAMPPDKKLYKKQYNYMFVWKESKSGKYHIRAAMWNSPDDPCK